MTATLDPQDPPANVIDAATELPNGLVTVAAQAHTFGHVGCMPDAVAAFIEAGTVQGMDTTCVGELPTPSFSISAASQRSPQKLRGADPWSLVRDEPDPMTSAQPGRSPIGRATRPYRGGAHCRNVDEAKGRPGPVRKGMGAMRWDLGLEGLGLLALMSLGFGVIAQLIAGKATTHWFWLVATAGYFVVGLIISEVWFGWATEEELQPNIDGLSFDEVLIGLVPGIVVVLVIRYLARRRRPHRTRLAH